MANDENANVVLTADTSGYTQGVQQATVQTNQLITAVDTLSGKLSNLTKSVGRKLVLFGAADMAAMAGMVKLASNFEDQMQTLNAQTKITGQSIEKYRSGVNQLARDLPNARGELAALTTQLKQSGVEGQKAGESMASTFAKLSKVTGSSLSEITQGMVDLSRQMGTLGNGGTAMEKFADSLTVVAAKSGVSATNVLSFANAIAPAARAAGIGQQQVIGLATAFSKAGADGYAAANTFNGMLNDITRSVNNGSPDLAKYSNLIGMTVNQFKSMDKADAITQIFEAINKQGPKAIDTLDRMGYDGVRALKSIQAVAQSGDIRSSVATAVGGFSKKNATNDAYAGSATLSDEMSKIGNSLQQVATNIGETLLPAATKVAGVFADMLSTIVSMTQPLQHLAGLLGPIAGVASVATGIAMQGMGALSAAAMGSYLLKGRGVRAFTQGFKGGQEGQAFGGGMGWANPIGRFATGLGAHIPAEPGASGLSKVAALPFRAASMFMRQSTQMYLDSMQQGENRPHLFGSSSNGGTSIYRDLRNSGASMMTAFKGAWEGAATLGVSAKQAAADVAKLGYATTRAGVSAIDSATHNIGGMALDGLRSVARGLGPIGLGLMGFEGVSAIKSAQDERLKGEATDSNYNPITAYNSALGIATTNTRQFADVVAKASGTIYTSVAQAFASTSSNLTGANNASYINPMVGTLSGDSAVGAAFVRSAYSGINTQNAAGFAQDITKRYGASASGILTAGSKGLQNGDIATLTKGANATNFSNTGIGGWFSRRVLGAGLSSDASAQYENIVGSIAQKVEEVRGAKGDAAAEQTKAALLQEFLSNVPQNANGGARIKAVSLIEQKLLGGEQLNYNQSQSTTDLAALLGNSDAGRRQLDNWKSYGIVVGSGATGATSRYKNSVSAYQVGINSTSLGGFASTNTAVTNAVATPSDPRAFNKGYMSLASQAMGGLGIAGATDTNIGAASAKLEELKTAIGDVNDPLYQLAVAAKGAVTTLQQIAGMGQNRFQRWSGAYQSNAAVLNNPSSTQGDRDSATSGMLGTLQEVNGYLDSIILAHRSYQRQMKHANEDFTTSMNRMNESYYKNMKRQAEDAAKSIYDPFQRVFAKYTQSGDSMLQNLQDQNRRIVDQRAQLLKLRNMGVSQQAIDTLDLANPQNAQQVARMVGDLANNPKLIAAINAAIKTRASATKGLVQSDLNQNFRRTSEDYHTQLGYMYQDQARATARAKEELSHFGEEVLGTVADKQAEAIKLIRGNLGSLGKELTAQLQEMSKKMPWLFSPEMLKLLNGDRTVKSSAAHDEHAAGGSDSRNYGSKAGVYGPWAATVNTAGKSTSKTYSSTSVDHSTNINIKQLDVAAADPAKLVKQLADAARIKKLARAGV